MVECGENSIPPSSQQPDLPQTHPGLGLGSGGCPEPFPSLAHSELRPETLEMSHTGLLGLLACG